MPGNAQAGGSQAGDSREGLIVSAEADKAVAEQAAAALAGARAARIGLRPEGFDQGGLEGAWRAIGEAAFVVAVLSEAGVADRWVRFAAQQARLAGVPLIPILAEPLDSAALLPVTGGAAPIPTEPPFDAARDGALLLERLPAAGAVDVAESEEPAEPPAEAAAVEPEEIPAEAEAEPEEAPAELAETEPEEAPAEVAEAEPEEAPAELAETEPEEAPAELAETEPEEAPAEVAEAEPEEAPAELAETEPEEAPAELAETEPDEAPAEAAETEPEEAPAEAAEAELEEAPAELAEAEPEEAPAEAVEAEPEEAPAEAAEAEPEEAPAEAAETEPEEAPAEVAEAELEEAPAELAEAEPEEAPAELAEAEPEEAPAEAAETEPEEAPAEVAEAEPEEAPAEIAVAAPEEAPVEAAVIAPEKAPPAGAGEERYQSPEDPSLDMAAGPLEDEFDAPILDREPAPQPRPETAAEPEIAEPEVAYAPMAAPVLPEAEAPPAALEPVAPEAPPPAAVPATREDGRGARRLRNQLDRLRLAHLFENAPRRMRVNRHYEISVRLSRDPEAGAGMPGGALRHELLAASAMSVTLDDPTFSYAIRPRTPETQWVDRAPLEGLGLEDRPAEWRWSVEPLKTGIRPLHIRASARIQDESGEAAEEAMPEQVVEVRVTVDPRQSAAQALRWTVFGIAAGVIGHYTEEILELGRALAGLQ